jgi:galactitol-specific phosphotransferase system IIC component
MLQLSVAFTAKVTLLRLHCPKSAVNIRFDGGVIAGGSVSSTVTVKVQVLRLPLASVAVLVTVVVPTGNVLPLAGLLTRFVTPQLSVAFTVNVTLLRLQ